MRSGSEPKILTADDGRTFGVCLSSDHCAEHEWGIDEIRRAFGMSSDDFGVDRRRVRVKPDGLRWATWSDGSEGFALQSVREWDNSPAPSTRGLNFRLAHVGPEIYKSGPKKGKPKPGPGIYEERGIAAAWDERSFAVRGKGDDIARLREVFDALTALDAAIWIYGGGPFGGHGLLIAIASRIPEDGARQMYEADRERHEVMEYHRSTGIEAALKAAGKRWYALSPKRFPNGLRTGGGQKAEPGGIAWWLNPQDQRNNNAGWYSLADLHAWARNEGPIPVAAGGAK